MARWADVSSTSATIGRQMITVPLTDDYPPPEEDAATSDPLLTVLEEARCPMCRTATRAVRSEALERVLMEKYAGMYGRDGDEDEENEEEESGEGYFTVQAYIILKAVYTWISEDAQPSPDCVEKGMLPLEWMLSFDGEGSMARCWPKFKHEVLTEEGSDSSYDDDSEYEE
ncbi:yeats family protein [Diplodia corticola]|uniref:Yeats family protein n=1 Tax=Diplodia corticola TaxID=236234 RepID=A0A1J9RM02_9PEZI|nr:yeats family protein [Diplodia corticola]OJD28629.1 yeats family protein [Diplodia corticola]